MDLLTPKKLVTINPSLKAEQQRRQKEKESRKKIAGMFPDVGEFRRELYQKHLEFFKAGSIYKERLFIAANRVGKSESGAFELTCHLTGVYPDWWEGMRFNKPIEAWACGTNSETTRDIVQNKLLGSIDKHGTGMIPADLIEKTVPRRGGIAGSIETIWVKHVTGGMSVVGLKSYEQGRESFEGTSKEVIWADEEPPEDCYTEMLFRTLTTRGVVYTTFTPLKGMSSVVKGFLEPENAEQSAKSKWYIQAGWKDVPHIPEDQKEAVLATTPAYQIKARTEGEPSLGAGAIYPIAEDEIRASLAIMPESWPRVYAMDVGWNRTAALWGARDPSTGIIYIYSEHYQSMGEPASHAQGIKARGEWIPGVIDPASNGRSQIDGRQLIAEYRKLGLKLQPAENAVETGILEVWQLLVSGKLKIMANCENFFREFKRYHRDDKGSGKIVKRDDHLMDCLRYLVVSGRTRMIMPPRPVNRQQYSVPSGDRSWMM